MKTSGLNLLVPHKPDVERDAVAKAFEEGGGTVHRIARFWDPPQFESSTVRVHGAVVFCLVLQQKLGFTLSSPDDELLLTVPPGFMNRQISRRTLGEISSLDFPVFIKPVALSCSVARYTNPLRHWPQNVETWRPVQQCWLLKQYRSQLKSAPSSWMGSHWMRQFTRDERIQQAQESLLKL